MYSSSTNTISSSPVTTSSFYQQATQHSTILKRHTTSIHHHHIHTPTPLSPRPTNHVFPFCSRPGLSAPQSHLDASSMPTRHKLPTQRHRRARRPMFVPIIPITLPCIPHDPRTVTNPSRLLSQRQITQPPPFRRDPNHQRPMIFTARTYSLPPGRSVMQQRDEDGYVVSGRAGVIFWSFFFFFFCCCCCCCYLYAWHGLG